MAAHRMLQRSVVLAACLAAAIVGSAQAADVDRNPPLDGDSLQIVLDRIRNHVDTDSWRKVGWKDADIERWLGKLVSGIAAGTESAELKLPVKMADVAASDPTRPLRENALILGRNVDVSFANKSIIMADGVVKVAHAQDCIIIGRSIVEVSHAQRCVIVAGAFVHVSHDGSRDGGSIVASRGWVDISHATGSHILAGKGISVSHANNTVFVNSSVQADRGGSKRVNIPNLPLELFANDPLSDKIEILGVVRPVGAVFRFEKKRYVAEVGQPIVNESGETVEALKGWMLQYSSQDVTVFSRNGSDAVIKHDMQ